MNNNIRGSGLKMDIAPQYLKSGFAEQSHSPMRRGRASNLEKENNDTNIKKHQQNQSQNVSNKKQLNTIAVQHMSDINPNRKSQLGDKQALIAGQGHDYRTKQLTPLVLNGSSRKLESTKKKDSSQQISRDQSGGLLIRTQREMTHRPKKTNQMMLNDSQNNLAANSVNTAGGGGNENEQMSYSDILKTNEKSNLKNAGTTGRKEQGSHPRSQLKNQKIIFSNMNNIQKVIGVDISMGNYASTQNDLRQTNEDVIRKYFEGKGQKSYTFSTGIATKQDSFENADDELDEVIDTLQNTERRYPQDDPMNIQEGPTAVGVVSQKYGHDKFHNKKQITGVVPKKKKMDRFSSLDPTRALTTAEKFGTLERLKEKTNSSAIERVEQKLAQHVSDHQKQEFYQRQQIRDSILNEFNLAINHKKQAIANNELLKVQLKDQIDNLKVEIKAGIELDNFMNDQFEQDNTLRCAFPRIHAPTDEMVNEEKKIKQKVLCEQYDQMMKEKNEIRHKELAQDKELVNKEAEKAEKAMLERDRREKENKKRVNEVCVKEWEMRLKAKEFLRKVRRNTVKQLNRIVQDGTMFKNYRDVSLDHQNQPINKYSRKGIYNHLYLVKDMSQEQQTSEERIKKEIPVHIRLFGRKDSPTRRENSNENAYKSNNRDWQRGLRQNTNPKGSSQEGPIFNVLNHGDFAKKKQFEILNDTQFDDYNQNSIHGGNTATHQQLNNYDMRTTTRGSHIQRMLLQKKYSQKNRSQSVERNSSIIRRNIDSRGSDYHRMPNPNMTAAGNTRSQKIQQHPEKSGLPAPHDNMHQTSGNPNYPMAGTEGKDKRLNRAKEYLDQVINAHQSKNKDTKSIITHQELVEIQDKLDAKSQIKNTHRDHSKDENDNYTMTARKAQGGNSLTKENLRRLENRDDLLRKGDDELLTYNSEQSIDIKQLLLELNLPENLFKKMEDMPEELWAYILDEIIYEAQIQKFSTVERNMIDNQKSKQEKLVSAIQKKRKDVAIENLSTIKNNHIFHLQEKKRTIERDRRMNELYPKNMKDETKSATWERKEQKQKQVEQYDMLKQQQENLLYPRNEEMHILQKQLEDRYFTELAQKAKQQEIEEILQKREERLNRAMSVKKDWDMNVNLNKLIKQVETQPKDFYDKLDSDKKKLQNIDDIFANNNNTNTSTTRRGGNHMTEKLRSIDQQHLELERKLSKKKEATIDNFESLISKVSKDIDKKSTYSRKLETQFQKVQMKQASKNRKLLQADSARDKTQTKDEIDADLLRVKMKNINPLMNINKERKKLNNVNDNDTIGDKTLEIDADKSAGKILPSKIKDRQDFIATGQSIKQSDNVKKIKPSKNVFLRLSEVAKKKDQGCGSSPVQQDRTMTASNAVGTADNEYASNSLQHWLDHKKGAKKTTSQQLSRASSKPKIINKQRPSTNLANFVDSLQASHSEVAPKKGGFRTMTKPHSPIQEVSVKKINDKNDKAGDSDEQREPLQSLLQSRQTNVTEKNPIDGWHVKPQRDDFRKLRNTSQVVQRKMQRTEMDKVAKLARIPDEIFYNDDAMMKMKMPGTFETKNIDFNHYKNKLAGVDKKRPKLADLFDDAKSRESSLDSSHNRRRLDRFDRRAENTKTAMEQDRQKPFKYTPITNPDTSFSRTFVPQSDGNKNIQSHLFPWENRVESIQQMNKIRKE